MYCCPTGAVESNKKTLLSPEVVRKLEPKRVTTVPPLRLPLLGDTESTVKAYEKGIEWIELPKTGTHTRTR